MLLSVFNGILCASVIWGVMAYLASQVNLARLRSRSGSKDGHELLYAPAGVERMLTMNDGAQIRTIYRGSGPTVVLVHSPGFSLESFTPLWEQMARIGFRMICFDLRGHGASSIGQMGLSRESMIDDIEQILEYFEVEDGILVGHGMGASMIVQALKERPDLSRKHLKGITSLAGFEGDQLFEGGHSRFIRKLIQARFFEKLMSQLSFAYWFGGIFWGTQVSLGQVKSGLRLFQLKNFRASLQPTPSKDHTLSQIEIPALIIQGNEDQVLPPNGYANKFGKKFNQAKVVWLDDAGFMLQAEKPKMIANLINEFDRAS